MENEKLTSSPASHVRTERRLLKETKGKLPLSGDFDPAHILEDDISEIREAFRNLPRVSPFNPDLLELSNQFADWEKSEKACMMLLHGRTAAPKGNCSWLSPATFRLIERYRSQGDTVVSHFCHRSNMEKDTPAYVVISSLIYQLLDSQASMLRDEAHYQKLSRMLSDPGWRTIRPQIAFDVLAGLLGLFPKVYVLLDRVDRIKGDADYLMDMLTDLIKAAKGTTKIFLVASSNGDRLPGRKMTEDLIESVEQDLGPKRFVELRIDQR